jgi:dihydrofolate synthase / folylpolyglutamate synthase
LSSVLADWLTRLEARSPETRIDLGLDRVARVLDRLGPALDGRPVASVAGTNGKGSVVAFLEQMALAAGHSTFAYSSPHVFDFGERMRLDGVAAPDQAVVTALEQVESARHDISLTWFEHVTLAALQLAADSSCRILVLEVGLGGRLDAVNAIDPDVAVVTSIGLDHVAWLGRTRLSVGREKLGIARAGKPLVIGEKKLPDGFSDLLEQSGAEVLLAGRDFNWRASKDGFVLRIGTQRCGFPPPGLDGRWQHGNAACAIMAAEALGAALPIDQNARRRGIMNARLPGRFQRVCQSPELIVDVAHNPAAARWMADGLGRARGPSTAVFGALSDKDVAGIARPLDQCFDHWITVSLPGPRGLTASAVANALARAAVTGGVEAVESVPEALRRALDRSGDHGRVVVFGSFHTVAAAAPLLKTLE